MIGCPVSWWDHHGHKQQPSKKQKQKKCISVSGSRNFARTLSQTIFAYGFCPSLCRYSLFISLQNQQTKRKFFCLVSTRTRPERVNGFNTNTQFLVHLRPLFFPKSIREKFATEFVLTKRLETRTNSDKWAFHS